MRGTAVRRITLFMDIKDLISWFGRLVDYKLFFWDPTLKS